MARLIAVRAAPGAAFLASLRRCWDDGAAVLPLPADMPGAALDALLATMRPAALLHDDVEQPLADHVPVADGVALVVTTSGSTGPPKGVELTHAALKASTEAGLRRLGAGGTDRWLCCLPLHHVAGLQVALRAWHLGHEPIVLERFDAQAVAAATAATHVSLVPTMLRRLLDAGVDLSHVRCVLLGGAPSPPALLRQAADRDLRVVVTYGMTETCGGCVYDGIPLDGAEARVDDDGTIALRGPMLFSGYRLSSGLAKTAMRDGWFRTADVGRIVGGRLQVEGRHDDVIITGGENVSATAIADVLAAHGAVAEAAVIGLPDPEWGQRVVAFVVPRSDSLSTEELRELVRGRLGRAAVPRHVVTVADLPRLSSGKVDREALAAIC